MIFLLLLIQNSLSTTSLCVLIRNYEFKHFKLRCHICIFQFQLPVLVCHFSYLLHLVFPHSFHIIWVSSASFIFFSTNSSHSFSLIFVSVFCLRISFIFRVDFDFHVFLPNSFSSIFIYYFPHSLSISLIVFVTTFRSHSGVHQVFVSGSKASGNANVTLILSSEIYIYILIAFHLPCWNRTCYYHFFILIPSLLVTRKADSESEVKTPKERISFYQISYISSSGFWYFKIFPNSQNCLCSPVFFKHFTTRQAGSATCKGLQRMEVREKRVV